MELDCGVGDVNITAEVLGKSSVSAGVGSIDLSLNGGEELYTLRIDKGLGNLDINGTGYKSTTYGNGSNKIDIDGGIGNIDINLINILNYLIRVLSFRQHLKESRLHLFGFDYFFLVRCL